MTNFLIDIDGTVCEDIPNECWFRFDLAKPIPGAAEWVNRLYMAGHTVTFFTSRLPAHKKATEEWLDRYGFCYSSVIYGKPRGGNYVWVDNLDVRGVLFTGDYDELL